MYRKMLLAAGVAVFFATPSLAAPCKDAHGKFIKCPPAAAKPTPAPTPKPTATVAARCKDTHGRFMKCAPAPAAKPAPTGRCRNAKGQFAKCGTPGSHPA